MITITKNADEDIGLSTHNTAALGMLIRVAVDHTVVGFE
jgi:hypothetical protein